MLIIKEQKCGGDLLEKTEIELLKDDKLSADIKQELLKYGINIDSNGVL